MISSPNHSEANVCGLAHKLTTIQVFSRLGSLGLGIEVHFENLHCWVVKINVLDSLRIFQILIFEGDCDDLCKKIYYI